MATFYDIAGTTQHYFTIGGKNGVTTYIGNATPDSSIGKPGDTYIQSERSLDDAIVSTYATKADLLNDTTTTFYTGYYAEVTSDEDHNNHTTVYEYDGSQWNFIYDSTIDDEPLFVNYGKIFTKSIIEGEEKWSSSSTYVTDEPILKTTEVGAGVYMLSAQSATNTNIATSTKENDYVNNHDVYGVTRFASDYEVTNHVDKFITLTPSQVYNVVTVEVGEERNRAINAETNLSNTIANNYNTLNTYINNNYNTITNDVSNKYEELSNKIDAISASSDVKDIVSVYDRGSDTSKTDIVHYDTSTLNNNDIIKVLKDETQSNATTYYRWVIHLGGTNAFELIGSEGPFYTTTEVDTKFVAFNGAQTINGVKTFSNGLRSSETIASTSNDTTVPTTAWVQSSVFNVYNTINNLSNNVVTLNTAQTISNIKTFDIGLRSNETIAANSNDTTVPTTAWVQSSIANFVTLAGTQTISGNKTFTGDVSFGANTTAVTQSAGDSSNKIATTEFVANAISATGQIPPMSGHNGQYLSTDGTNAIWTPVTMTLNGLSDVTLNAQSDGQTIVYNNTSNKWENGNPTVATIRYW